VLADVAQWTGVATIGLKFIFKYGGWAAAALATPVSVLLSGLVFFGGAIAMQGGAAVLGPQVRHSSLFYTYTSVHAPGQCLCYLFDCNETSGGGGL
jgi:ATP/ADP translocase